MPSPTAAWLRQYAQQQHWGEDFQRFDNPTVQSWLDNYWDPNQMKFRTAKTDRAGNPLQGFVEKPDDTPAGWHAWGQGMAMQDSPGSGAQYGPASALLRSPALASVGQRGTSVGAMGSWNDWARYGVR